MVGPTLVPPPDEMISLEPLGGRQTIEHGVSRFSHLEVAISILKK